MTHKVQSRIFRGAQIRTEWRKFPYNWSDPSDTHLFHREDGPALIWENGEHMWWLYGHRYDFTQYLEQVKSLITEEEYFILVLTYGDEK